MLNTPKSLREQALDILREDLVEFGRRISPQSFYHASPPVHEEIARLFLDYSAVQQNIIAPRGIAKTTLVTFAILHHLFLGDEGQKLVAIVSKTQTHAKSILSTIKNILNFSPGFRKLFGFHGEQVAKVWRDEKIVLDDGNGVIARGTGQPIRGVNENLQRPTLVVIDDPEDENNTKTIEAMQSNMNWLLQAAVPSLDTRRGRVIVIGTPLHEKCIVMTLSTMKDWKTVHFGNDVEGGISLWEESRPLEWLKAKRDALKEAGYVRMYYQEYECKLIPGEDALFRQDYIQYYDSKMELQWVKDDPYLMFPNGVLIPVNIYMGVDPASSTLKSADYSTIVPIAVAPNQDIYILDYYRKRVHPLDLAEAIETWYLRFRPRLTTIESTGYQEMLRGYMRSRIFIPGLELKEMPRQNKSARLEMLQPYFAQKKVFMKEEMKELVDELLLFPKAKHDDLLDALYYAVKRSRPATHAIEEAPEEIPEYKRFLIEYYENKDEEEIPTYFDPFGT